MRFAQLIAMAAAWLAPCTALGADSTPASASDDRIALSANGSTLPEPTAAVGRQSRGCTTSMQIRSRESRWNTR